METTHQQKNTLLGISLAVLAAFIWSGNFIIARRVYEQIPPVSLNFYRWLLATVIIAPFALKNFFREWPAARSNWHYLFWVSLTGISLFNAFVYVAGHYTTAINMALIGTTSSPIMAVIMARIFLKERIGFLKLIGMMLCIAGVLYLLSKGNLENLLRLKFGTGDLWMLLAAFSFAVYNTLVKKKPAAISPVNFLFTSFLFGTILMLPIFLLESFNSPAPQWDGSLFFSILYLALGASVICFFIWNKAIRILGAGRTILFGNLIPIFSTVVAVIDPRLHEKFTWTHFTSLMIVFSGLLLANLKTSD